MLVRLSRWGNALAMRLPKSLAQQIDVVAGQKVSVTAEGDRLIIHAAPARWMLEDMLVGMTPSTRGGVSDLYQFLPLR